MRESIFRVLSFFIALGGAFAYATEPAQIYQTSVAGTFISIAVFVSFTLYAFGGSALLEKLSVPKFLNENSKRFFTSNTDANK